MSEVSKNEQLIHALLDGDLNPSESQKVRALLKSDPSMGRLLEELRQQKEDLSQLPRFSLPENFSDRVLNAAQENAAKELAPKVAFNGDATAATGVVSQAKTGFSAWQIVATAVLSSAATLMFSLFLFPGNAGPRSAVASNEMIRPAAQSVADESVELAPAFALAESAQQDEVQLDGVEVTRGIVQTATGAMMQQQFAGEGAIEQVWLLESHDEASKMELMQTLADNSIQLPISAATNALPRVENVIDEEIDGILIEATSRQMRKALVELADSEKFEISAFPLPGHETYFADIQNQQSQTAEVEIADAPEIADLARSRPENQSGNVESFDAMAAKVIEDVKSAVETDAEGSEPQHEWPPTLKTPAKALAQQLRGRRFSNVLRIEEAQAKAKEDVLGGAIAGDIDADALDLNGIRSVASEPPANTEKLADASSAGSLEGDEADETLQGRKQNAGLDAAAPAREGVIGKLTDKIVGVDDELVPAAPELEQQNLKELFPQDKLEGDRRGSYLLLIRNSKSPGSIQVRPRTTRPRTTRPRTTRPRTTRPRTTRPRTVTPR